MNAMSILGWIFSNNVLETYKLSSTASTRIFNTLFLGVGAIISVILVQDEVPLPDFLHQGLNCTTITSNATKIFGSCEHLSGVSAVYRIQFSLTIYFLFMSIFIFVLKPFKKLRHSVQNAFWFYKIALLITIMALSFYVPAKYIFSESWIIISGIGAIIFTVAQLLIFMKMGSYISSYCNEQIQTHASIAYFWFKVGYSTFFHMICFIGTSAMFLVFTKKDHSCKIQATVICVHILLCFLGNFLATLPKIKKVIPNSGNIQHSMVAAYTTFLVYNGLISFPIHECYNGEYYDSEFVGLFVIMIFIGTMIVTSYLGFIMITNTKDAKNELKTIGSKINEQGAYKFAEFDKITEDENSITSHSLVDYSKSTYSYSLFYLILLFGSMYTQHALTSWKIPTLSNIETLTLSWIKLSSNWICHATYVCSLLLPLIKNSLDINNYL